MFSSLAIRNNYSYGQSINPLFYFTYWLNYFRINKNILFTILARKKNLLSESLPVKFLLLNPKGIHYFCGIVLLKVYGVNVD